MKKNGRLSEINASWIFSLRNRPDSGWGSPWGFMEGIYREANICDDYLVFDSEIFGTTYSKDYVLKQGDGIAFYHTDRAKYDSDDPYGKLPRISLMGEILDVQQSGRRVERIEWRTHRSTYAAMLVGPIIRDKSTEQQFLGCNLKDGRQVAFKPISSDSWSHFASTADFYATDIEPADIDSLLKKIFG